MGPPSHLLSVIDQNVVMQRMTVLIHCLSSCGSLVQVGSLISYADGKVNILLLCAILLFTTRTCRKSQLDICIHVSMRVDAWAEAPAKLKVGDKNHVTTGVFCMYHCIIGCMVSIVSKEHKDLILKGQMDPSSKLTGTPHPVTQRYKPEDQYFSVTISTNLQNHGNCLGTG
jgi:hypothetical protein